MNPRPPDQMRYITLVAAAQATDKVGSLTHSFYRYPARFGEAFIREAVQNFSRRGETVLDPFCGGGTTIVEALVAGREAIGVDLNELAIFVTRAKTTPLSTRQLQTIRLWLDETTDSVRSLLSTHRDCNDPQLNNVPGHYRNLLARLRERVAQLPRGNCRDFTSCLLLKTGQWAFDGKEHLPTPRQWVSRLWECFEEMCAGMHAYASQLHEAGVSKNDIFRRRRLYLRGADSLSLKAIGLVKPKVALVVTSPPYPGVHVLYHRWQVRGRRESKAPFFLTRGRDLGGASAYTILDRNSRAKERYFATIESSFRAIKMVLRDDAYVIQLVSFANAQESLIPYLNAMESAGLQLCESYLKSSSALHWRSVPGRRWYARVGAVSDSSASNEVLLVHRKAS